jgi:hypothetical protein
MSGELGVRHSRGWLPLSIGVILLLAKVICPAQEFGLDSTGARWGLSSNDRTHNFNQAEGFVNWNLPWRWDLCSNWQIQHRLDISAGWLGGNGNDAAILKFGPTLVLVRPALPVSIEGGISPTLMTRSEFGSEDFGIPFQFTSHAGINWDITRHIRIGYRFQHMSNGHLSSHNPGLNLHMFGASYLF